MPGTGCCGIEYGCVVEWGVTKLVEYDEPIDEQESCTDDSIKEIIRKY